MSINFRRGFFRLWMVLAVLWVLPALYLNSEGLSLTASHDANPTAGLWEKQAPRSGGSASGFFVLVMPDGTPVDFAGLPVAESRSLILEKFPDFDFGTDAWRMFELRREALETARGRRQFHALLVVFAPPLVLLVLGLGIGWIASGFRPSRP